jgi:hypothetical protein
MTLLPNPHVKSIRAGIQNSSPTALEFSLLRPVWPLKSPIENIVERERSLSVLLHRRNV